MQRSPWRAGIGATAALLAGCTTAGASVHPDLTRPWREYGMLPAKRAMAIAGDPRRDRWVTASTGGHATRKQAEAVALSECRARRLQRRLQAACVLYAVEDEIVWPGP